MSAALGKLSAHGRTFDTLRANARLLLIDLRRCGGVWPLPLALGIVWFLNQYLLSDDPVFWQQMSTATMQTYVVLGPFAAGVAAWQMGRDRRRRMDDFFASTASPVERRDLLAMGTGAGWGLIAYALIGAFYLGLAVLGATWGGPDLILLAVGALAIVFYAALGVLIGRVPLGRFTPLVAVAATASIAGLLDMVRSSNQHQPLRTLSPWGFANVQDTQSIFFSFDWQRAGIPWALGLIGGAIAIVLLLRDRSLVLIGLLVVSIGVAVSGAMPLLDAAIGGRGGGQPVPFTWSCTTRPHVELCVHPAWDSKRDETADLLDTFIAPIAGLPGVPTRAEQGVPYLQYPEHVVIVWDFDPRSVVDSVGARLGTPKDSGQTAAELTVLAWLASNAGIDVPGRAFFGFPSDIAMTEIHVEGGAYLQPDDAAMEAYAIERDAAVARFSALTPAEQRAWFEANWDALRAGTLTMDDLP